MPAKAGISNCIVKSPPLAALINWIASGVALAMTFVLYSHCERSAAIRLINKILAPRKKLFMVVLFLHSLPSVRKSSKCAGWNNPLAPRNKLFMVVQIEAKIGFMAIERI
jgi:hypothetical protein